MRGGDGVRKRMINNERPVDLIIIDLVMTELLEINLVSCFTEISYVLLYGL